jgi:putative FmdB family regulatory protein
MPLYEYVCDACGRRFEKIQKFSDPAPDPCPHCGKGPVTRQMSSPAIQFKGSGFYITDYAKKGAAPADSSAAAASENKSESKSENKTEKKSEGGDSGSKDSGSKDSGSKDSGSKDSGGKSVGGPAAAPSTPAPAKPSSEN